MMTDNARRLLKERYCSDGEQPEDVYKRVALALESENNPYDPLLESMVSGKFLPNSPALRNAGKHKGMLHACFILPCEDTIEDITTSLKNMIMIFKPGGGVGINFSKLRHKDAPLSTGGSSSGVVSFMGLFDTATEVVKQGGFRRGALMGILRYDHPEILKFIQSKLTGKLTNFNISVLADNKFMEAVKNGTAIEVKDPRTQRIITTLKANTIYDAICFCSWSNGDPGIIFYDRINQDNPLFPAVEITATNPCGEVPLPPYSACCLGSINLSKFVADEVFDTRSFRKTVRIATLALKKMNQVSHYPLPEITEQMQRLDPVGVGIMGFADCLIKMGVKYDSPETLEVIDVIGAIWKEETNKWGGDSFYKRIIAPTGSLSLLADCSSGIEPIFARNFDRHLTVGVMNETRDIYDSEVVRTAHEVSPEWHLTIQARWQQWADGAISKTINMPNSASIDDIRDIYMRAWQMGVKGVTVFRDGSKDGVLRIKCEGENCSL